MLEQAQNRRLLPDSDSDEETAKPRPNPTAQSKPTDILQEVGEPQPFLSPSPPQVLCPGALCACFVPALDDMGLVSRPSSSQRHWAGSSQGSLQDFSDKSRDGAAPILPFLVKKEPCWALISAPLPGPCFGVRQNKRTPRARLEGGKEGLSQQTALPSLPAVDHCPGAVSAGLDQSCRAGNGAGVNPWPGTNPLPRALGFTGFQGWTTCRHPGLLSALERS